jgi:hypothetical protein
VSSEVSVIVRREGLFGLSGLQQSGLVAGTDGRFQGPGFDPFDHREETLSGFSGSLEALDHRIALDLAGRGAAGEIPNRRGRLDTKAFCESLIAEHGIRFGEVHHVDPVGNGALLEGLPQGSERGTTHGSSEAIATSMSLTGRCVPRAQDDALEERRIRDGAARFPVSLL